MMTKDGMMRKFNLIVLGAMLALGGMANAAPAVNEGYDWALRVSNEDRADAAILAYEVDGTDDQPLNFTCEQASNRIFVGISGHSPDLSAIDLVSGDAALHVAGTTETEEMPYFSSTEEIAGDAPFFRAFVAKGWLRMTDGTASFEMAATASGKQAIADFARFCTG
ncbi:hypothetical protein BWQ93_01750 [Sphingopyxis sp. QXT-31]|uniref:hypothetical protein n=1 Tax=Sphingopyxis sp. QXT-31 TaxID=1357916 RepID=UPI0009792F39|nr:hypothetical protein [Sphingopyxis sp. QXT-31]APZ97355.1 hypothetical protein BWQ93_01750 [Sphingopyxis sp. QXT-31]